MTIQRYAIIDTAAGLVVNVTIWDGKSPYVPENGFSLVQADAPGIGWRYTNGEFSPPAVIPPTEETLLTNQSEQTLLLNQASQAMAPLLLSLQLGNATDAEAARAKAWQS